MQGVSDTFPGGMQNQREFEDSLPQDQRSTSPPYVSMHFDEDQRSAGRHFRIFSLVYIITQLILSFEGS